MISIQGLRLQNWPEVYMGGLHGEVGVEGGFGTGVAVALGRLQLKPAHVMIEEEWLLIYQEPSIVLSIIILTSFKEMIAWKMRYII
ncbi:unnamed protein product [Prunus armeniaca]|uniref:Uncharacterized protein n=1 Tax=Prunus armeniaca TaxID=36596 RepID=A0A6J5V380_PRUAR|nr:unnamed protein product [Prunus armeniaca]